MSWCYQFTLQTQYY